MKISAINTALFQSESLKNLGKVAYKNQIKQLTRDDPREETKDESALTRRILDKFNSGKKLSVSEIMHLSKYAPQHVEKVRRITAEREQLEAQLKLSRTKAQARTIGMISTTSSLENIDGDSGDSNVRANQMRDAIATYEKSKEYKEKPENNLKNINSKKGKTVEAAV